MTKYTYNNLELAAKKILADSIICLILLVIAYLGFRLENGLMVLSMSLISGFVVLAANNFLFYIKCRKFLQAKGERG